MNSKYEIFYIEMKVFFQVSAIKCKNTKWDDNTLISIYIYKDENGIVDEKEKIIKEIKRKRKINEKFEIKITKKEIINERNAGRTAF